MFFWKLILIFYKFIPVFVFLLFNRVGFFKVESSFLKFEVTQFEVKQLPLFYTAELKDTWTEKCIEDQVIY